jgi:N-acyl-D-amino-acid deacylase
MRPLLATLALATLLAGSLTPTLDTAPRPAESFDVLLRGGTVVDGTGAPGYRADVGVRAGRIAAIGDLSTATAPRILEASGQVVAPGFIDLGMGANLAEPLSMTTAENMLQQGVTTGLIAWEGGLTDKKQERADLERHGLAINVASFFPLLPAWQTVVGPSATTATPEQVAAMQALARTAFEDGAFGIGAAIEYCPLCNADTASIVEVAKAGAGFNVYYASHIRNEANGVVNATAELIAISEGSGIPGHVGHMKVAGAPNCGLAKTTTGLVEAALTRGLDISASQYPYTAGQTTDIGYLIPDWAEQGTEADIQLRFRLPPTRAQIVSEVEARIAEVTGTADRIAFQPHGTTLAQEAQLRGVSPGEAVLQIRENNEVRLTIIHFGCEEDLLTILEKPWTSIQSDMGTWVPLHDATIFHPRGYGTFPRVLGAYGRDQQVFGLEEAVRRMTGQSAYRLGLAYDQRGLVQEGWAADLVVLDPQRILDQATYEDPGAFSDGVQAVLVNGVVMKEGGQLRPLPERLLAMPGEYLLHRADMPSTPQPGYDFRAQAAVAEKDTPALPAILLLAAVASALLLRRSR